MKSALRMRGKGPLLVLVQGPETTVLKVWRWLDQQTKGRKPEREVLQIAGFTDGMPNWRKFEGRDHNHVGKRRRLHRSMISDKTIQIRHAMVGGILDHEWSFWCNWEVDSEMRRQAVEQTPVVARLLDFVSRTNKGNEVAEPVTERTTIPWKRRNVQLTAPNVFSATKWVRRNLSTSELLDIYGVNTTMRLGKGKDNGEMTTDFTQQIPAGVLIRCLESILWPKLRKSSEGSLNREASMQPPVRQFTACDSMCTLEADALKNARGDTGSEDEKVERSERLDKKNDDAEVEVDEWNRRVAEGIGLVYRPEKHAHAMDVLRRDLYRRYCHHRHGVIGSFRRYMRQEYGDTWLEEMRDKLKVGQDNAEIVKSYDVGIDAIRRALGGSFWEWSAGSTVIFWRWPRCLWKELRDGVAIWFRKRELPKYWRQQHWPKEAAEKTKLKEKLAKVVERGYITRGFVRSLTGFFAVPKGEGDIRVVYDAMKSGLNNAIWTPNFCLPTMKSVLDNADSSTYFGDIDLGEMFLNYFLDPALRPYAGVDLRELDGNSMSARTCLRWERSLMGVRSSPFNCVRIHLFGAWMYKYDEVNGAMASFVVSYVDDLRTGSQRGKMECDRTTHTMAAGLNYLGEQDAARKRKSASQKPGPWAGAVIEAVDGEGLYVSTSDEKWKKMKNIIERYSQEIEQCTTKEIWVDRKRLEQDTGFLVHMFLAYENMRPYLKGFYLSLNSWRFDRDDGGWRLGKRHWEEVAEELWGDEQYWEDAKRENKYEEEVNPKSVCMVPQMITDVHFLRDMFANEQPTRRLIRGRKIAGIIYGFGDASGAGFGASWVDGTQLNRDARSNGSPRTSVVKYRFGRWGKEVGEGSSSNYRELRNLVDSLEEMGKRGELVGVEVFLFTDNSTAEAAFNRGSSSSPLLFELVKRAKLLEMCHRSRIHVIHVAGTRMIDQGTDGLSRGALLDGVMKGECIRSFLPLHETALQRSAHIIPWLREAHGGEGRDKLTVLSKEDWFWAGHDIVGGEENVDGQWVPVYVTGQHVWAPPPCVAERCLEELRKARHKRQSSTHVFVCPRIMTVDWQRHLYKSADLILVINPGHTIWPSNQHEPLILGFYFPYLCYEPWHLKGSKKLVGMGGHLQRVCKENPSASGCLLRQLWQFTRKLPSLPEQLVHKVLQGSEDSGVPKTITRKRRRSGVEEKG